ncbi:helix-turn-helix domain-containing protein [Streptomyces sp. NPDC058642]|uniref:helix-turn-helix domain-containing protein n=1 Tax=Streptomyces sp. NPDC058642 TaxID=3346572 RepID=UPI00365A4EA4
MTGTTDLGRALHAWRDRTKPAEVGLPGDGGRRAPGLRREELAQLAGLSVDYIVRLEQGRSTNPSPHVLSALARALRLTTAEREHFFSCSPVRRCRAPGRFVIMCREASSVCSTG